MRSENHTSTDDEAAWTAERQSMVDVLRNQYGISDARILDAMGKVRRHRFIPPNNRQHGQAYGDHPCPVGFDQTISQPYIVAFMTRELHLKKDERVLEIGAGSGYQAAILAECGAEVHTVEIIPELARHARETLEAEGYSSVRVRVGDGHHGWPEKAPFDAVIVTCAASEVPKALCEQLKEGGRMILPVGGAFCQQLVIQRKIRGRIETEESLSVRFVPMVRGKP
jgi:protein-L-isoaspartate(D-aspartate) O-methyltransferase